MAPKTTRSKSRSSTKTKEKCTWCESNLIETYLLPAAKKVFCSQSCLKLYRNAYSKGACPNCDNPIRYSVKSDSDDSKTFCSTVCLDNHEKNKPKASETSINTKSQIHDHPRPNEKFSDWDSFLNDTNSEAAPAFCFKQHLEPPENEFEKGMKLEARDDQNPVSSCLGTVIETTGPRIKIRLDGGDSSNDLWRLVDSNDIFVCGTTNRKHGNLQPPFGSRMNVNSYRTWLKKRLNGATLASAHFFKEEPATPRMNYFKIGQKLEAVDPHRPNYIAVATINRVNGDDVHITFDGDNQSTGITCKYYSRDIFPAGWCEKTDHPLYYGHKIVARSKNKEKVESTLLANPNNVDILNIPEPSTSSEVTLIEADTTKTESRGSGCTSSNLDREPSPTSTSIEGDETLVTKSLYCHKKVIPNIIKKNNGKILITEKEAATSTTPTEITPKLPPDPSEWSTENVISYISYCDPLLSVHADILKSHEIDGKALLLLNSDTMMKYMGLKLGPALKICSVVAKMKSRRHFF